MYTLASQNLAHNIIPELDPTKLKGRQFSRSTAPASGKPDNSLWTETPGERQQRLADEVSGKKRRAVETQPVDDDPDGSKKRRRRDEELIRKGVEDHTVCHTPMRALCFRSLVLYLYSKRCADLLLLSNILLGRRARRRRTVAFGIILVT